MVHVISSCRRSPSGRPKSGNQPVLKPTKSGTTSWAGDVTDYGLDRFDEVGLLLFTIRNGNHAQVQTHPKGYAEKIMMVCDEQATPYYFHWNKREDIINRGGGNLVIELYHADGKNKFSERRFSVSVDGVRRPVSAGDRVILAPGVSICLEPYVYHTFYGEKGSGSVMVGEVSDVNDDRTDNCFYEQLGRFPEIIEDEEPRYYLCTEYPQVHRSDRRKVSRDISFTAP